MRFVVGFSGLALVLLALLACKQPDPETERIETCKAWRLQAHELARDLRYAKVTPWEANGKANEIKDALERNRCHTSTTPEPQATTSTTKRTAKKAVKPGCEGLDPEVCAALASKPKASPPAASVKPIEVHLEETPEW